MRTNPHFNFLILKGNYLVAQVQEESSQAS